MNKTLALLLGVQTRLLETEQAIAASVATIADELKAEPVPSDLELQVGDSTPPH